MTEIARQKRGLAKRNKARVWIHEGLERCKNISFFYKRREHFLVLFLDLCKRQWIEKLLQKFKIELQGDKSWRTRNLVRKISSIFLVDLLLRY